MGSGSRVGEEPCGDSAVEYIQYDVDGEASGPWGACGAFIEAAVATEFHLHAISYVLYD